MILLNFFVFLLLLFFLLFPVCRPVVTAAGTKQSLPADSRTLLFLPAFTVQFLLFLFPEFRDEMRESVQRFSQVINGVGVGYSQKSLTAVSEGSAGYDGDFLFS